MFPESKHFLHLLPHPPFPIFFCRAVATAAATFVFHSGAAVRGPSPWSLGVFPRFRRLSLHHAHVLCLGCLHGLLVHRTPLLPYLRFQIGPFAVFFHLLFLVFLFRRSAGFLPVSRGNPCIFACFLPASPRPGFAGAGASSSRTCLGQLTLAPNPALPSL